MLQSRGISRASTASALRQSLSNRTTPIRLPTFSTRQFSQKLQSQNLSQTRLPRPSQFQHSSVFAQRSGAARSLSIWGFGSSKPSQPASSPPVQAISTPEPPIPDNVAASITPTPSPPAAEAPDLNSIQLSDLDLDYHSLLDFPEKLGFLKDMGLDYGWGPTSLCQWMLEHIYIYTGMPWWASIAATAFLIRAAIAVPTMYGAKHQAKLSELYKTPEMIKAKADFEEASFRTHDRALQLRARGEMKRLMQQAEVKMYMPMIGLAVVPFTIGMFRLLRGMSSIPVPSMEMGGLWWFSDLAVSDPYYVLPALSVAFGTIMLQQSQKANANQTEQQKAMMKVLVYVIPPLTFLGTYWLPAAVQWFFLMFSVGSIAQTRATLSPRVREWFGLPPLAVKPESVAPAPGAPLYQAAKTPLSPPKESFQDSVQKGIEGASAKLKEFTGNSDQRSQWKKANDYEEQRAKEDKQRQARRLEELRQSRRNR
ncbi:hypothetical protein F5Y16DRAFT_110091 [Xylariaceae sp. FL0255]|nr:hypothetical protein F5Y16DRAFT_110091 [Xylariaceae sp. FL0255]